MILTHHRGNLYHPQDWMRSICLLRRMIHTNRLSREKSPYLLQHQHNPVDWYPWSEEAFSAARVANKPIFLSIGYSTCHWCHVMERESFENEDIAKIMNDLFVNIKVDREERPDVDSQYMLFVQATSGGGGWPMSVFLTPDLKPILGGTYFPPEDSFTRPGFPYIMKLVAEQWNKNPEAITLQSDEISKQLLEAIQTKPYEEMTTTMEEGILYKQYPEWINNLLNYYRDKFDKEFGGFGSAPKFPTPVNLLFLSRIQSFCKEIATALTDDTNILKNDTIRWDLCWKSLGLKHQDVDGLKDIAMNAKSMINKTLMAIWRGGIHDHVGRGIHRYAVDKRWHIPHFEKMLYDQGQLLQIYSEALLDDPHDDNNETFRLAIADIISYMRTNLRDPAGAFYCAEDADSLPTHEAKNKLEGAFAVWTEAEIKRILPEREGLVFCFHFGVKSKGNVSPIFDHQGELRGQNILMEEQDVHTTAKKFDLSEEECKRILSASLEALASVRTARPRPHLDDKILVSWNALAISGLCRAYEATKDSSALLMAEQAVKFIKERMVLDNGRLIRSFREGPSSIEGFSTDYALLIAALLDLWKITLNIEYIEWAKSLQSIMNELFWDQQGGGGYYNSPENHSDIRLRMKDANDGAEPSVNSMAASNLIRLHLIDDSEEYKVKYRQLLMTFTKQINEDPQGKPIMISTTLMELMLPTKITFLVPNATKGDDLIFKLKEAVEENCWSPFRVYALQSNDNDSVTVQFCRGTTCQIPTSNVEEIKRYMQLSTQMLY